MLQGQTMLTDIVKNIPAWSEVRIRWQDAYSPASGWHNVQDYETDDSICTTIGRLWQDCQTGYITIVGTVFESELPNPETVSDINHIPVHWLVSVEVIHPAPKWYTNPL